MLSRSFTHREQWIMVGLSVAIITGAGVIAWQRGLAEDGDAAADLAAIDPLPRAEAAEREAAPEPDIGTQPVAAIPEESAMVTVAVRGAVRYPGMYALSDKRRVDDLLDRAGGVTEAADLRDINIAARLVDGTTLTVPAFPDSETGQYANGNYPAHAVQNPVPYTIAGWQAASPGTAAGASSGGEGGGRLDLNRASKAELETLPGIGPVTAASIISYREQMPFQSVEELEQVSGIGPKRLEAVRDLVTVPGR